MKKIILISSLLVIAIAGIVYANSGSKEKSCCADKKSCANKEVASSTCDNGCSADKPCDCSDCGAACKAACDKAGHCVCGENQLAKVGGVALAGAAVCSGSCNQSDPCSCADCSGECKAACEKAGHCVCGSDNKLTASANQTAKSGKVNCNGSCDESTPCSCSDCSGECKAACEKAGTCVCN